MMLYLRLAWRNVWRHRRRTLLIMMAMGLALSMMMAYDGLVAGFDQAIYGNAIKVLGGNIQVHAQGYRAKANQNPMLSIPDDQAVVAAALTDPRVVSATRRINTGGLASSREGAFAVGITGIEPEKEQAVNLSEQYVKFGRILTSADTDSVFIGKGLAAAMGVSVGDRITLVGQAAHSQMRQRTMTVVGIFDLGMTDIEKRTVYISLAEAQSLYDLPSQSTEIAIVLQQIGTESSVIAALKPSLPNVEIESFEANYPELQAALGTKGGVMTIFSIVIMFIAGIGILNLLLMAVYERTREIGVLGAMGLRPAQISALFILEGTMIGLMGVVFGIGLGLILNGLMRAYGLDFSSYSTITTYMALVSGRVYPSWGFENLLWRAATVAIIAALSAVIPAREAASREPAEALHFV